MTSVYFENNPESEKIELENGFKIIHYLDDEGEGEYSNAKKYYAELAHITTYDKQGNKINEELIDNPNLKEWVDDLNEELK